MAAAATKTSEFTYVLDVTFWSNGKKRRFQNLKKLDMLPNQAAPLLIFMGVSDNAGNAVFLVDSTLSAAGEGKCKPSRDDCAFLYLGAGAEEEFTNDDNDSYRLIVNEIKQGQGRRPDRHGRLGRRGQRLGQQVRARGCRRRADRPAASASRR